MIITALFSFKKYSSYVHATMGLMIWALTLGLALPFLIEHGINHPESRVHSHKIMGVTVLVCGSFQCAVGLLGKFFQRDPTANSVLIYVLRKIHLCHGYAILLLAKATGFLLIYGASYVIFVCLLCW